MPLQKRKRPAATKAAITKAVQNHVKEEWDELPHNMGKAPAHPEPETESTSADQISIPPPKKARTTRSMTAKTRVVDGVAPKLEFKVTKKSSSPPSKTAKNHAVQQNDDQEQAPTAKPSRKRAKKSETEVPAATGSLEKVELDEKAETDPIAADLKEETPSKKKRTTKVKKEEAVTSPDVVSKTEDLLESVEKTPKKKPKKTKDNPYGLTPGYSPFAEWAAPTAEQCQEVTTLLASVHSLPSQPLQPPTPSITTAGCGEVPAVLDAMIRTLLSAATSGRNSSSAFQGLLKMFGTQEDGVGKGSVNWHKVRDAPLSDVFEAIKSGGLAKVKSAKIKQILDMVFEQNTARRAAKVAELEHLRESGGVEAEDLKEKENGIEKLDEDMLSLNHMHELESEVAMTQLTKFPNIGVKTASCILLFCLHRPSFAVDTHVWRLCKWLGWVPPKATRDETFSHLEVRCPDDLKYPLHQLLIMHGKKCGRCRANTGLGSRDYVEENCPIDHLVARTGKRKGGGGDSGEKVGGGKKKKKGKKAVYLDDSEDDDDDELSEWDSDEVEGGERV